MTLLFLLLELLLFFLLFFLQVRQLNALNGSFSSSIWLLFTCCKRLKQNYPVGLFFLFHLHWTDTKEWEQETQLFDEQQTTNFGNVPVFKKRNLLTILTKSAPLHWADSVIKSPCPSVWVCLSVCAIGFSFFKGLSLALRSHD